MKLLKLSAIFMLLLSTIYSQVFAQKEIIPFSSGRWNLNGRSKVVTVQGKEALQGGASLKDFVFENGIIEFDVMFEGSRTFGGINFRQNGNNLEHFYIRPHKSRLPDALQYTPVFNGMSSWQLYNGDGFTAAAEIPHNKWFHVKMEVLGTQARVYLQNADTPALVIPDLKQGIIKGSVGLFGPPTGIAYFTDFRIQQTDDLAFDEPRIYKVPLGMITEWELSPPHSTTSIDLETYPDETILEKIKWKKVEADKNGLVDISRHFMKAGNPPAAVFAKTKIHADAPERKTLEFGYSDFITIFVNGKTVFFGNSIFRSRDAGFAGIAGLNDRVYIDLAKGDNEIMLMVGETFGGWGFLMRDVTAEYTHTSLQKQWEITDKLAMPESAVYDKSTGKIYVSNFNRYGYPGSHYISRINTDGTISQLKWAKGLQYPTGVTVSKGKLYTVERRGVAEIDLASGKVLKRYPVASPGFLNDITAAPDGTLYISDSRNSVIYILKDGEVSVFLQGKEVSQPNGLYYHENYLLAGCSGDQRLKKIDPVTKKISIVARFEEGGIDGIRVDKSGNYLVSLFKGKLYRVTRVGEITKLLDTSAPEKFTADFEYIPDKDLLVIPSLDSNSLRAYSIR